MDIDTKLDFNILKNVKITGIDIDSLTDEEENILYTQSRYCQAMVDADIDTLKSIVSPDVTFTHMSGMIQTRDEYFEDIKEGRLNYYNIGIESPVIKINGNTATIEYTSVLDANAYGAKGVYRMHGKHKFRRIDKIWYYSI